MFTLFFKCLQSMCTQFKIFLLCGGVIPLFFLMISLKYGNINLMRNLIPVLTKLLCEGVVENQMFLSF